MKVSLKSLKFTGFQSKNVTASIVFAEGHTSIIYGHNGSGKTTFLKLIHAVLAKNDTALAKENVQRVEIAFVNSDGVHCSVVVGPEEDLAGGQGINTALRYSWAEFDESDLASTKSLSLGIDRGTSIKAAEVEVSDIYNYVSSSKLLRSSRVEAIEFSENLALHINRHSSARARLRRGKMDELNLSRDHAFLHAVNMSHVENLLIEKYNLARAYASEQIQKALFDTLALVIEPSNIDEAEATIPADLGPQIAKEKERIIEALNEGADNNFKDRIVSILQGMHSDDQCYPFQDNKILTQLFWNVLKELKLEKQLLDSINTFVDTFNDFLGPRKSLDITKNGIALTVRGQSHGVDALSSGERHLFTFLALVVTDARDRDFLIIDEPEISLNANWQRVLVKVLQGLAPETQIILASHSPILAKGQPASLVELSPVETVNA
jgi:ABC-type cobalamin/Fe3+-siderophores transport system ATPase subunit